MKFSPQLYVFLIYFYILYIKNILIKNNKKIRLIIKSIILLLVFHLKFFNLFYLFDILILGYDMILKIVYL